MHEDFVPPLDEVPGDSAPHWKTEFDVMAGLGALGHDVRALGVHSDLSVIREALDDFNPHITFNLLEEFHGVALYDQHVISYLELLQRPYTGCNPRGLMLSHDKALSKKLLTYHRVPVPKFAVFPQGRRVHRPKSLEFPLIVKSLIEHASMGISQASVVHNDAKLRERVEFIHTSIGTDAIVEQYLEGRELTVCVIGNQRLQLLPILELEFNALPEGAPRIQTERIKRDMAYQKRVGVALAAPTDLGEEVERRLLALAKRSYKTLGMSGYGRMDFRLTDDGRLYVLEANANADISVGEELADSAELAGIGYEELLQKVINLGLSFRPLWKQE